MEEKEIKSADSPNEQAAPPNSRGGGCLRTMAYGSVIIFFGILSFAVIVFVMGMNKTNESVVEPVSNLVRQLTLPVTPVILPNPATIVREINDLSRLETASYEYEKVITAETKQEILWGTLGESMVFVAHGKVIAGVDFAEMAVEDMQVYDPQTVYVYLPEAKLFDDIPVLDNERSFVADRDTGIFTRADPQLETQVRVAAEKAILEAADESEILERANLNAKRIYSINFLGGLGFVNVIFHRQRPDTAPPIFKKCRRDLLSLQRLPNRKTELNRALIMGPILLINLPCVTPPHVR